MRYYVHFLDTVHWESGSSVVHTEPVKSDSSPSPQRTCTQVHHSTGQLLPLLTQDMELVPSKGLEGVLLVSHPLDLQYESIKLLLIALNVATLSPECSVHRLGTWGSSSGSNQTG